MSPILQPSVNKSAYEKTHVDYRNSSKKKVGLTTISNASSIVTEKGITI